MPRVGVRLRLTTNLPHRACCFDLEIRNRSNLPARRVLWHENALQGPSGGQLCFDKAARRAVGLYPMWLGGERKRTPTISRCAPNAACWGAPSAYHQPIASRTLLRLGNGHAYMACGFSPNRAPDPSLLPRGPRRESSSPQTLCQRVWAHWPWARWPC